MSSLALALAIFAIVFGAMLTGLLLRRWLPAAHLNDSSRDSLKLAIGLVASLVSLVLGLVVSSSKSSFDLKRDELQHIAADVVLLDRTLAVYGPGADPSRLLLRNLVVAGLDRVWGEDLGNVRSSTVNDEVHALGNAVRGLQPQSDAQQVVKGEALRLLTTLDKVRVILRQQETETSVPAGFLIIIVFWLGIVFGGFGLLAIPNPTVVASMFIGAACVAGALFLVLELDRPYGGVIRISDAPLREALSQLGQPGS